MPAPYGAGTYSSRTCPLSDRPARISRAAFIACTAGNRLAPRFPAPSQAASGVPPLATPPSHAASPPPDAQSAVRHAGGLPALALTTAQRLATGCCGPPHRRPRWKRPFRHRPGTFEPRVPGASNTPASLRVKVRPELPGNFPLRKNLSRKFRSFPLDPLRRGGAARASRAKARRARRKSSAHARAAFAR